MKTHDRREPREGVSEVIFSPDRLSADHRIALNLHYVEGLGSAAIATRLKMSEDQVVDLLVEAVEPIIKEGSRKRFAAAVRTMPDSQASLSGQQRWFPITPAPRRWWNWFRGIWESHNEATPAPFETDLAQSFERLAENAGKSLRDAFDSAVHMVHWQSGMFSHSARVALLAREIGSAMRLSRDKIDILGHAAELHEIGMVSVPAGLVESPDPLTATQLMRVRAQAWIGGEMLRTAYPRLKGDLVEAQYSDLPGLVRWFPKGSDEYHMAGILRVADVFDTLKHPRPYQRNVPEDRWREVVESGAGQIFHRQAAETLLRICA
jgi:hypothetical protein